MALFCDLSDMINESDVEQKFIFPFLNSEPPIGLGFKPEEILTKHILRQRVIGKGQKQKYYYPDYLISIRGIPVLVVEAKAPDIELSDGYTEARLYAHEVNASFPHKLNACQFVIACNGKELWVGYSDQAIPFYQLKYDEISSETKVFGEVINLCSRQKIQMWVDSYYATIRGGTRFDSPVAQLGGNRVQNEEMVENSFGRTLVFENRNIFDPETENDRSIIVENAYIPSAKREQHAEPMYKEIRRFELPSQKNTTSLSTEHPDELVGKLSEKVVKNQDAYSLMLIIGNVGSGKTTFTRYFKYIYLEKNHPALAQKCEWVFINMNFAPLANTEIYSWLKNNIITSIKANHCDLDFDDYSVIKRIFRRSIADFDKGLGQLLRGNELEYNKELFRILNQAKTNPDEYLESLLFFIKENYAKIPIIVLDNCDKRNKEEQLLMFEVAQWLRTQYKCIVILPMRDSTYDVYKSEPPLDTVVRDLVFRIDPPDLLRVLQSRLDYITRNSDLESNVYVLTNNMQVAIKRSELVDYFKYIMVAIRRDRWISTLFYGLTSKNIRNGIQIFEDFCKSGHMVTEDILAMRVLGDDARIPTYRFVNVLLRKNRRFYKGDESNFVNLFSANYSDDFPDPFVRVDILNWLYCIKDKEGPSRDKGYFPIINMMKSLQMLGHNLSVIERELSYLIKRGLVFCESFNTQFKSQDLIKISISGRLHMKMLSDVVYLAACSEDAIFKDTDTMMQISNRLKVRETNSRLITLLNARDFVNYLIKYREEYLSNGIDFLSEETLIPPFDIKTSLNAVDQAIKGNSRLFMTISAIDRLKPNSQVRVLVRKIISRGIVCIISGEETIGFIPTNDVKHPFPLEVIANIKAGDQLICEVTGFSIEHQNFQLRFVEFSE